MGRLINETSTLKYECCNFFCCRCYDRCATLEWNVQGDVLPINTSTHSDRGLSWSDPRPDNLMETLVLLPLCAFTPPSPPLNSCKSVTEPATVPLAETSLCALTLTTMPWHNMVIPPTSALLKHESEIICKDPPASSQAGRESGVVWEITLQSATDRTARRWEWERTDCGLENFRHRRRWCEFRTGMAACPSVIRGFHSSGVSVGTRLW